MRAFLMTLALASTLPLASADALTILQKRDSSPALNYLQHVHPDPLALVVVDFAGFEGTEALQELHKALLQIPPIGNILLGTNSQLHELIQTAFIAIPDEKKHPGEMPTAVFHAELPDNFIEDALNQIGISATQIEGGESDIWVFREPDFTAALTELPNGMVGFGSLNAVQSMTRLAAGKERLLNPADRSPKGAYALLQSGKSPHSPIRPDAAHETLVWIGSQDLTPALPPELVYSGFPYVPKSGSLMFLRTPTGDYKMLAQLGWKETFGEEVARVDISYRLSPKKVLEFLIPLVPPPAAVENGFADHGDIEDLRQAIEDLRGWIEENPGIEEIEFTFDIELDEGGLSVDMKFPNEMLDEAVRSISQEMRSEHENEYERHEHEHEETR